MPPFFDVQQIDDALRIEALPALERFAAAPRYDRFDRDEPPPYVSSESEDEAAYHPALGLQRKNSPEIRDLNLLMEPPLNDDELADAARITCWSMKAYNAGDRFRIEAAKEQDRLDAFCRYGPSNERAKELLRGRHKRGIQQRNNVIIRRNIRRRWQKLGVWNPQWGIPGRACRQPNDEPHFWKWRWQRGNSTEWDPDVATDAGQLVLRAVQQRRGLRLGEHNPPPPRFSNLDQDATTAQAESFITSRPWFMFAMEAGEHSARLNRMSLGDWEHLRGPAAKPVAIWWKERGDWRDDWNPAPGSDKAVLGWKWRHESPSPEPEDMTPLNNEDMQGMDFTPSEIDALENISPPTPPKRWPQPDPASRINRPCTLFGTRQPEPSQNARVSPPHQRQQRRTRQRRDGAAEPRDLTQLRRSARIKARKAKEEPPPAPDANRRRALRAPKASERRHLPAPDDNPRQRQSRRRPAARPVPARPPPTSETPRPRGRPRRARSPDKPSAVSKVSTRTLPGKRARTAAVAAAAAEVTGQIPTTATKSPEPAAKRARGRPRRTRASARASNL